MTLLRFRLPAAIFGIALPAVAAAQAPYHTVSVDPRTHRVYLPLENVNGRPVLQVYEPGR